MGMGRRRKRNKGRGIVWGRGRGEWWREIAMEERRGEQEKGVEGGEESGVKLSGRRELREGTIQKIYSKSPFFKRNKSQGRGGGRDFGMT